MDKAVIANITDQQWVLHRTYGNFLIGPCPASRSAGLGTNPGSAGYALTEVTARKGAMDLGDKRTLEFPISAREVADDLAREVNADGGDGSYFGVFVCAGAEPTEAELTEARARLGGFYTDQVRIGDQEWERTHNHQFITDVERRAARWLGVEKDWCYEPKPMVDCPACGEKLKPGVAVCKSCGAVLDREKALQFGLVKEDPAERDPARPESPTRHSPAPKRFGEGASRFGDGAPTPIPLGDELAARPVRKRT